MSLAAYVETLNLLGDESRIRLCVHFWPNSVSKSRSIVSITSFIE